MSCIDPQAAPEVISVTRGETKTLTFVARDDDKQPIDITGAKVWFNVKNRIEDVAPVISKKNVTAGGVDKQVLITLVQTGATKGQLKVFLTPPDTAGLDSTEFYWCDCWIELTTGERRQVLPNSEFKINPAVTTSFT